MAYEYTPAYEHKVWSYSHAPPEYKALFNPPKEGYKSFIVWERKLVEGGTVEWVSPGDVWWGLYHWQQAHSVDNTTTVYLLTEMVKTR